MACSASVLWTVKQFIQNVKFPTYLTDSTCNHLYSLEVKGIVYLKAQSHCCMLAAWRLTPRYPGLLVLVNHIHPTSAVRCFIPLGVLAIHANLWLFRTLGYLFSTASYHKFRQIIMLNLSEMFKSWFVLLYRHFSSRTLTPLLNSSNKNLT